MTAPAKKNNKRGPESRYFDALKGRDVRLEMGDGSEDVVRLVWVDHFSIGIEDLNTRAARMIYKHAITAISEA